MAAEGTLKAKASGVAMSITYKSARNSSFDSSAPRAMPRERQHRAVNSVSKNSTSATWRFSMPSTQYRPNSARRRLMRKLLV